MKRRMVVRLGFQLGSLYLLVAVIFLSPYLKRRLIDATLAAEPTHIVAHETPTLITGQPVKLQIPSVSIELAILPGEFNGEAWSLNSKTVHFATNTHQPNNVGGNTLIYGHNTPAVLKKTAPLESNDVALVETDTGYQFVYRLMTVEQVKPDDLSVFSYQGEPRLTLLTCHGAFNTTRQLMYFKLESIKKI